MRAAFLLVGALAFSFVVSGCLDAATGSSKSGGRAKQLGTDAVNRIPIPEGWAELALVGGGGHDHRKVEQHFNLSTANFELLGWNPLITDYHGKTAGGYFCGSVVEKEGKRLSVVHSWVSDVAFIITDVTDAANPKKIGEFVLANTHVYDLTMTEDQRTVLLATSPGTNSIGNDPSGDDVVARPVATFRDACTGEETPVPTPFGPEQGLPFASGVIVVDIQNPRAPAITDFKFFPLHGGHSVQTRNLNGRVLVLISVPNGCLGVPVPCPTQSHSYYVLAEVVDGPPAARRLDVLSFYQYSGRPGPAPGVQVPGGMHDGYLQKHPITGQSLAYLAYGSTTLVILNIDDPRNPRLVSHWADWARVGEAAPSIPFVHEALPIEGTWEGRHYTFIGEECGSRRPQAPTCLVVALDTTEPTKPTYIGVWNLPLDPPWTAFAQYSPHYLGVVDRTLFITNYHGGMWAVDVSTPQALAQMPNIGVFMPANPSPKPIGRPAPYDFTPVVLDVNPLSDGNMVVYDGFTGLYIVRFDATNPAPAMLPVFGPARG